MKRMLFLGYLILSLASFFSIGHAEHVPLPDDLMATKPSSDISKEIASFSGAWIGSWDGILPHVLVVERVESDGSTSVIYAIGDCPEYNIKQQWARVSGKIEGGELKFSFGEGRARLRYRLDGETRMIGFYETDRITSYVVVDKTISSSKSDIEQVCKDRKMRMEAESIQIPIRTRGLFGRVRILKLEATLYRPSREGRFPMVIFNHGSTGPGHIPATLTLRNEAQSYFFLKRGYSVISPMRKGRGASEGTYSESYACDHPSVFSGVRSAIEDLDGVFDFLLEQPYVDTENILVSGISRGGYLSVVYAGKGKHGPKVKGVINFVGGWMGEKCGIDLNSPGYEQTGKATKLPMLWLYSQGDSFYSPVAIRGYLKAFTKAGGYAEFKLYDNVPRNGHFLASFISIWKEAADRYLDTIGFGKP